MSENTKEDQEDTIDVNAIIDYLNQALVDLKETNDYLSYSTLLDVHLSNPEKFTDEEKKIILKTLHTIFIENLDIVKEIGWDLPELLLPFYNLDWDFEGTLRETGIIDVIMGIFDTVAKNANPKELFIKSIEILGNLPVLTEEEKESESFAKLDRILDVKIHTIIELLSTSMKRINTLYPSKFLSMALGALLQFYARYAKDTRYTRLLLRRLYCFARDYIPPLKPLSWIEKENLTQEEADKLIDDENYLQRLLLQTYLTNIYGVSFNYSSLGYSFLYYHELQLKRKGFLPIKETPAESLTSTHSVFSRLFTLCTSYDIEFVEEFAKLKKESVELFRSTIDSQKSDDEKIQDCFKFSINNKIANLLNPDSKTIPKSPQGLLILCTQYKYETNDDLTVTAHELISLAIRFLSPGLISDQFRNFGVLDSILYLSWSTIINSKPKDFSFVPKFQLILFLQIIVFYCSIIPEASVNLLLYTLLTRLLTLIDEETSYNFIIDTLTTAPFQNSKAAMINILKDLVIRERPPSCCVSEVTDALQQISLSNQPPVPKRQYITLNKDRVEDIYALIRECIDETFSDGLGESKLLLGYLNLLIGIRKVYPADKVQKIVDIVKHKLENEENDDNNNIKALLIIAIESLEKHLSENK